MRRLSELWRRFDGLSDVRKSAVGCGVAVFLFCTWLYTLGFLGLAFMSRQAEAGAPPSTPSAMPSPTRGTAQPTTAVKATKQPAVVKPAASPTPRPVVAPTARPVIAPTAKPAVVPTPRPAAVPTRTATSAPAHPATPVPTRGTPVFVTITPLPTQGSGTTPVPTIPGLITPGLPPTAMPGAATPTPGHTVPTATPTGNH